MTSVQLPPLEFEDGALDIMLGTGAGAPKRISLRPSSFHSSMITDDRTNEHLDGRPAELWAGEDDVHTPRGEEAYEQQLPSTTYNPRPQTQHNIPVHPIPVMQAAFAESLDEVTNGGADTKPNLRELDARARRDRLLDQEKGEEPVDLRWRYRPGQKQHEVLKLVSQITFGVYLLLKGMANDNTQVVNILQGHIDEVDEFLEVTLEDLNHSLQDMSERIDFLKLPMTNEKMFEELLEDRGYRAEILEGNEKIEHILARTNTAMKQWDDDVDAGLECTTSFKDWLIGIRDGSWRAERPELVEVYDAMRGNADGWLNAFDDINSKTQEMNGLVIKLMTIASDMEKKAGEVSRKTWSMIPPFSLPQHGSLRSGDTGSSAASSHRQSMRSSQQPGTRTSVRSNSFSTMQQSCKFDDDDSLADFPLPGSMPLLPPTRFSKRLSKKQSLDSNRLRVEPAGPVIQEAIAEKEDEEEEGPLLLLQPRTYTPQPPEPLPSPMIRDSNQSYATNDEVHRDSGLGMHRQTSIRHRISQKGAPPGDIIIPPKTFGERRGSDRSGCSGHSGNSEQTPVFASPRSNHSHARERVVSNESDIEAYRQQYLPRVVSHADLRQPQRPPLGPSYNSDFLQHYQPVRASPHSPLQQRPHTAAGPQASRQQSGYFPNQLRDQPSRQGGMSTLSRVTNAPHDQRPRTPGANTVAGGKSLKKKKSAFGWLKKAFTLDEEEKAAFEQRKQMHQEQIYYKDKSPKFLDGRRLR